MQHATVLHQDPNAPQSGELSDLKLWGCTKLLELPEQYRSIRSVPRINVLLWSDVMEPPTVSMSCTLGTRRARTQSICQYLQSYLVQWSGCC